MALVVDCFSSIWIVGWVDFERLHHPSKARVATPIDHKSKKWEWDHSVSNPRKMADNPLLAIHGLLVQNSVDPLGYLGVLDPRMRMVVLMHCARDKFHIGCLDLDDVDKFGYQ